MATKIFINYDEGKFVLAQTRKENSFEVEFDGEEIQIAKALLESTKLRTILEKCAKAGYFLHSKKH